MLKIIYEKIFLAFCGRRSTRKNDGSHVYLKWIQIHDFLCLFFVCFKFLSYKSWPGYKLFLFTLPGTRHQQRSFAKSKCAKTGPWGVFKISRNLQRCRRRKRSGDEFVIPVVFSLLSVSVILYFVNKQKQQNKNRVRYDVENTTALFIYANDSRSLVLKSSA